ncbi:hypothetical protein OAR08_00790 [Flavobacteriaceae bacterium]|nr:hypothetical protein [Flavobacteriaceae bacterium]
MIRNITDEQARHMVDILKKKSELIKNFYYKIDKYRISGDRETYRKKFKELLEKEEIKVYGKKIE